MGREESPDIALQLFEALLTAEVFNLCERLDANDLHPRMRSLFGVDGGVEQVRRPVHVSEGQLNRAMGLTGARKLLEKNPFVSYEEFGQRFRISAIEPAARWFLSHGGEALARRNPVLAYYCAERKLMDVSYEAARASNPPVEDTRPYLEGKITRLMKEDESLKSALELAILSAPEEVEQRMDELVCTPAQEEVIRKIKTALQHRIFLRDKKIYEIGKLLFVGPPGTGKTSLALALSRELHMPVLEVRLSMITSQYLGETSKNIDRIFEFAKKIAPCILFIDEFDFVAKSRITDDHGAMKRAVNMLLKNIDRTSLIRDRVLLIGATNHPQLLDEAAWRRFDEVVEFPLPDPMMRRRILEKLFSALGCDCEIDGLVARTERFSGADLRVMVKEGLISALSRGSGRIGQEDIERGIDLIVNRNSLRFGG